MFWFNSVVINFELERHLFFKTSTDDLKIPESTRAPTGLVEIDS